MTLRLCVFFFGVLFICPEYEALGFGSFGAMHQPPRPRPQPQPSSSTPGWDRSQLPEPEFSDDPDEVGTSLVLFNQALRRDPCRLYCSAYNLRKLREDCGVAVEAMVVLARNNHPTVKPECATARRPECKWKLWKMSTLCYFTITKPSRDQRTQKEKSYRLKECLKD